MDGMERNKDVYFGSSLDNVLYQLKSRSNLQICGGCTFLRELPRVSLIIRNIDDFKNIEKRERYMEIGSGVTLSAIMELGEKHVPPVLFQALESVATPIVRNMATLGGNLCLQPVRGTLFAPLLAMDALLEFRRSTEIFTIPMNQLQSIPDASVLTKVRIPLNEWDVSLFRRVGPSWTLEENCASYAFLASIQKEVLLDLRIAFCGILRLRSRDLENRLVGTKLPLSRSETVNLLSTASEIFDQQVASFSAGASHQEERHAACKLLGSHLSSCRTFSIDYPLLKARFLGLLRESLNHLT